MYLAHVPSKVKSYEYLSFKYIHERKLVTVVNIILSSICPEEEQSHYFLHSKKKFVLTNQILCYLWKPKKD